MLTLVAPLHAIPARSGDGRIYAFVIDDNGTMWGLHQTALGGPWSDLISFGTVPQGLVERPALALSALMMRGLKRE